MNETIVKGPGKLNVAFYAYKRTCQQTSLLTSYVLTSGFRDSALLFTIEPIENHQMLFQMELSLICNLPFPLNGVPSVPDRTIFATFAATWQTSCCWYLLSCLKHDRRYQQHFFAYERYCLLRNFFGPVSYDKIQYIGITLRCQRTMIWWSNRIHVNPLKCQSLTFRLFLVVGFCGCML